MQSALLCEFSIVFISILKMPYMMQVIQCSAVQCSSMCHMLYSIPYSFPNPFVHSLKCQYSMSKQIPNRCSTIHFTLCAYNVHTQNVAQKKNELNNAFHTEIIPQRILYQLCVCVHVCLV